MTTQQPTIPPERIYIEALHSAGPCPLGADVEAWREHVDHLAGTILAGSKAFVRRQVAIQERIELRGTVTAVEPNPISESGRQLDLFKVVFRADTGTRIDQLWLDKRDPMHVRMFEIAEGLVGKRARIVKVRRAQFEGDDPKRDAAGEIVTSPYLESIEPLDEGAAVPSPPAASEAKPEGAQGTRGRGGRRGSGNEAPAAAAAPSRTPSRGGRRRQQGPSQTELLMMEPQTPNELVELAGEHFGLTPEQVKDEVENIIGKKQEGKTRTRAEMKKAWSGIVYAHTQESENVA